MAEKDAAAVGTETFSHRIAAKADKLKFVVLAVIVILAAAIVIVSQQRKAAAAREAEAENKVFQTLVDIQGSPEANALPTLTKMADEMKALPAGGRARIMAFSYAYNTRDYKAAESAARDFLAAYPKSPMAGRARLGLGQALLMQERTADAAAEFKALVDSEAPEVFPEAKLAYAQTLELEAEKVKDDPAAYRSKLEAAEQQYNDIVVRSQITVANQRGFWPQAVTLPANFALVVIKDKLAGYEHPAPRTSEMPAMTAEEREAIMTIPPPADPDAEEASEEDAGGDNSSEAETEEAAAGQ